MEGDKSPLKHLVELKNKYGCLMMVDEAHATGIFGTNGAGVVEEENLENEIDFIMGTFSKAMAGYGAYLAAEKSVIDYLVNTCRSFIYSTALPPGIIAGNIKSIELIGKEPHRRKELLENADFLRESLRGKGFKVCGESQIVPLVIGDNDKAVEYAKKLQEKGHWVLPVRPPTVPEGESRLRFSLSYFHNRETIKRLVDDILQI
jgi:7-keto-8-aminopelargonate synthetase-like enzyme